MSETILAMLSGGLDSTFMVHHLLTDPQYAEYELHVHHINLGNIENRKLAEKIAVDNILSYFNINNYKKFTYSESTVEFEAYNNGFMWDIEPTSFMSGYIASRDTSITKVAIGATSGELKNRDLVSNRETADKIFSAYSTNANKIYPVSHLTKIQIYNIIPTELRNLTWSCRIPKYISDIPERCGDCKPCIELELFEIALKLKEKK
jgi:7-cyano-7-deazaguanine synthase in queuosine biosynthesis